MTTVTVIRSRMIFSGHHKYNDIVYTVLGAMPRETLSSSTMEVHRHVYRVYPDGTTWLASSESFSSEEMGIKNWINVHTTKKVERFHESD